MVLTLHFMLDYFDYMKNYKLNKHNYFLTKIDKLTLLSDKNLKTVKLNYNILNINYDNFSFLIF